MADSSVAITAGSGTAIDTRTEGTNGNHRQVVVVGDPTTNAGVAPVDATNGLTVDLGSNNDVTVTNATAANLKVDGSDVTQPVSGTVTANLSATDNAVLDNIDASMAAVAGTVGGTELQVDVVGALPAGTNAIGKLAANSGVDIGDVDVTSVAGTVTVAGAVTASDVAGDIAHDSADSGNPVKVGAKAIAALSGTTLVAAADRTNAQSDLDGALLVRNTATLGDRTWGTAFTSATTDTTVASAAGAGIYNYITNVQVANTGASDSLITFKDGASGTTLGYTVAPAGGGSNINFDSPLKTSANTAFVFGAGTASTSIYVSAEGFKSKI